MRAKSIVLLVLALGCGLVASIGITQVMAKRNTTAPAIAGEVAKIFVAMSDVPMGDPITPQVVKLEEWPKDKVPPGALTKMEDLEGRRPKSRIPAGVPILDSYLLSKGASDQGATGLIPKGYRVVSVKVDQVSGGASLIRPADRVDVLVHLEKNGDKGIPQTSTRTVLQDIKVFAVNDVYAMESADKSDANIAAKTISLLVTPDQAEKVTLATELGKIRLVMRSADDDDQTTVAGVSPQELFGIADGANRSDEDPLEKKPVNDDFLKLLESQKKQAPPEPVAQPVSAPQSQSWTIRILSGGEVSEAVLQSSDATGSTGSDSGVTHWTLTSPGGGSTSPSAGVSSPAAPVTEPTETPQETPVSTGPASPSDPPSADAPAADVRGRVSPQ
jgi:pilus assembly protein CpaB